MVYPLEPQLSAIERKDLILRLTSLVQTKKEWDALCGLLERWKENGWAMESTAERRLCGTLLFIYITIQVTFLFIPCDLVIIDVDGRQSKQSSNDDSHG